MVLTAGFEGGAQQAGLEPDLVLHDALGHRQRELRDGVGDLRRPLRGDALDPLDEGAGRVDRGAQLGLGTVDAGLIAALLGRTLGAADLLRGGLGFGADDGGRGAGR